MKRKVKAHLRKGKKVRAHVRKHAKGKGKGNRRGLVKGSGARQREEEADATASPIRAKMTKREAILRRKSSSTDESVGNRRSIVPVGGDRGKGKGKGKGNRDTRGKRY